MSFHVYSEDAESPVLQEYVNETIARQEQTPSPRTELLSPTSPTREEPDRRSRRSQRGPSERFRRQREEAYASVSARQLLSLLVDKEYEASKLRKGLHRAFDRVEGEAQRVAEAERVTQETLNHFRAVNEARIAAERALAKTNEELGLWKFQFEHVQRELKRAQDVVKLLERQLDDAEKAAAKARAAARRLNELRVVSDALEEGRRLGFQTGYRQGQEDRAFARGTTPGDTHQDLEIEDSGSYSYSYTAPQRGRNELGLGGSVSQLLRDVNTSPVPAIRSPEVLRMPQMPPTHSHPAQPPERDVNTSPAPVIRSPEVLRMPQMPPTHSHSAQPPDPPPSMPVPITMPSPLRARQTEYFPRSLPPSLPPSPDIPPSPNVSVYPIEIPSASELNAQAQPQPHRRGSSQARQQPQPQNNNTNPPPPRSFAPQLRANTPSPQPEHINILPLNIHRRSAQFSQQHEPNNPNDTNGPAHRRPVSHAPSASASAAHRPVSQAPSHRPRASSVQHDAAPPPRRPSPLPEHAYEQPRHSQYHTLPDNYIPSLAEDGAIALPPPWQLSPAMSEAALPQSGQGELPRAPSRTESWYNNNGNGGGDGHGQQGGQGQAHGHGHGHGHGQTQGQGQGQGQGQTQSWYQAKRGPRSAAGSVGGRSAGGGSVTGRSNAGSTAGAGRHTRQASLDSRLAARRPAGGGEYAPDLRAIREVDASPGGQSQRARSMRVPSAESLVPPPVPAKDRKQIIADELRYSDPDLPDSWRREGAADTASSKSRPPRHVRVPTKLTFPAPLSPPSGAVPLGPGQGHIRVRTMSGSTAMSGRTQPLPVDLGRGPSLRRVAPKRPVSPSDVGTPYFGSITIEPPSQSSSRIPLTDPRTDQYHSPNYHTQPLPVPVPVGQPGTGFVPQSITIPAQITVPVSFKGKTISSPIPSALNGEEEGRPLSRAGSTSALSRKSGRIEVGPTLTVEPGHGLTRQASNTSLNSTGSSYARFDAGSYVDPAYFAADENAPHPVPAPRSRKVSASSQHSGSGLSYIGPWA